MNLRKPGEVDCLNERFSTDHPKISEITDFDPKSISARISLPGSVFRFRNISGTFETCRGGEEVYLLLGDLFSKENGQNETAKTR